MLYVHIVFDTRRTRNNPNSRPPYLTSPVHLKRLSVEATPALIIHLQTCPKCFHHRVWHLSTHPSCNDCPQPIYTSTPKSAPFPPHSPLEFIPLDDHSLESSPFSAPSSSDNSSYSSPRQRSTTDSAHTASPIDASTTPSLSPQNLDKDSFNAQTPPRTPNFTFDEPMDISGALSPQYSELSPFVMLTPPTDASSSCMSMSPDYSMLRSPTTHPISRRRLLFNSSSSPSISTENARDGYAPIDWDNEVDEETVDTSASAVCSLEWSDDTSGDDGDEAMQ